MRPNVSKLLSGVTEVASVAVRATARKRTDGAAPSETQSDILKWNNIALDLFLIAQKQPPTERSLRSLETHLSPIFNLWRSFISCQRWKSLYWISPQLFASDARYAISLSLSSSLFRSWHNNLRWEIRGASYFSRWSNEAKRYMYVTRRGARIIPSRVCVNDRNSCLAHRNCVIKNETKTE